MSTDLILLIFFLVINLLVGIKYSRNIKNFKEYAVGDKKFSTSVIVATIVATWIGGEYLALLSSEVYDKGLYFIMPLIIGNTLMFMIVGYFLVPRMAEFFGMLTNSEILGHLYGPIVRVISGVANFLLTIGVVGMQFKASSGLLTNVVLGITQEQAVILTCVVVILYSTFGGIKAVTFTDVIQFLTFGAIIPAITFVLWETFDSPKAVVDYIKHSPNFDFNMIFNLENERFWDMMSLFFFYLLPGVDAAIFQRFAMSKNPMQARKAFTIAGFLFCLIFLSISWIGILLSVNHEGITSQNVLTILLDNYGSGHFKIFVTIGIMAMIMSTADSYINAASIAFVHDICGGLGVTIPENRKILVAKLSTLLLGVFAIFVALKQSSMFQLLVQLNAVIMVSWTPFMLNIIGFRTTTRCTLSGMIATSIFVAYTLMYPERFSSAQSVLYAILVSVGFTIVPHYALQEPKGWVGTQDRSCLEAIEAEQYERRQRFWKNIKNFNFIDFCKYHAPVEEYIYSFFGVFSIISTFAIIYSMPYELHGMYSDIINFVSATVLPISSLFLLYPIIPTRSKSDAFISILWMLGVFYILVCADSVLVFLSGFGYLQSMIFMVNIIILAVLFRWYIVLGMIIAGLFIVVNLYTRYLGLPYVNVGIWNIHNDVIYILLLVSSVLVVFFKPDQEHEEMIEREVLQRTDELKVALSAKNNFLSNASQEIRAPSNQFAMSSSTLVDSWGGMSDTERFGFVENISVEAKKLGNMMSGLLDLSCLISGKIALYKENLDFISLTRDVCKNYNDTKSADEQLVFDYNTVPLLNVYCDRERMTQALSNFVDTVSKLQPKNKAVMINIAPSEIALKNKIVSAMQVSISINSAIGDSALKDVFAILAQMQYGVDCLNTKSKLNLSISKEIIKAHLGELVTKINNGSVTLSFIIPL